MPCFRQGKSYAWLFPPLVVVFLGSCALAEMMGNWGWGALTLPLSMSVVAICEYASGVALDSWWRAIYPRGTWQFSALLAWHATGVILLTGFSLSIVYFIHTDT